MVVAEGRTAYAAQHFDRVRRPRDHGGVGQTSKRTYHHAGPSRSLVLNAFLHELGALDLVPPGAALLNEHALAPGLVEFGRKYFFRALGAAGGVEKALALSAQTPAITNDRGAQLYLRQAVSTDGELGAIARDYEECAQRGAPADARLASCIMATFAGRLVANAETILGLHLREELRGELGRMISKGGGPLRRHPVRAPSTPSEGQSPAAAPSKKVVR